MNHPVPSTLIVMIGVPASGKSSLARALSTSLSCAPALSEHALSEPQIERSIVSTDAIRGQLFGDAAIQGSWRLISQEVDHQLRIALRQIQQGQLQGVIYDATNARRSDRCVLIRQIRRMGFEKIKGIWLDPPLIQCLERNCQRSRQVPEFVIHRMHRSLQIEPPHLQEGFDYLVRYGAKWLYKTDDSPNLGEPAPAGGRFPKI